MLTFKQVFDKDLAWEYYQAGLLWCAWADKIEDKVLRRYPEDRWTRLMWEGAIFNGHHDRANYILIED